MSRRALVVSTVLAAIAAFGVAFAIARYLTAPREPVARAASERSVASAAPSGALPVMWKLPPFAFRDQNDRPTSNADFRGRVVIADFVFTSCTTVCPLITAKMAQLQRRLTSEKIRFVSFSVDPARDTPEALQKYATAWRPGESRWTLLSTTPDGLESLAAKMFVSVKPIENDIAHSSLFFLVDEEGGVRGIYESDRNDAIERLLRDTQTLLGAAPTAPPAAAATGSELYAALGCGACHARKELAPPLENLLGRPVKLEGGSVLRADRAYIRESIVAPEEKLSAGYALRMPSYEAELTPPELDALVAHLETLGSAAPSSKNPSESGKARSEPERPAAEPTEARTEPEESSPEPEPSGESTKPPAAPALAVDPVCSMSVRVVETTPRATHAGRTVYFCSELCRERFVAEPARYVK